jgi:outer membrane protein W
MKIARIALPCLMMTGLCQPVFADSSLFSIQDGDGFKRFAVSAGWLHVMPQGKPNNLNINTAVPPGRETGVGEINVSDITENADLSLTQAGLLNTLGALTGGVIPEDVSNGLNAKASVYGIDQWRAQGTGIKAEDVDTLGLMLNYFFTDNVSVQLIGGVPPKVDLKGVGNITAPLHAQASANLLGDFDLNKDIQITNLDSFDKAASVRAWTPAVTLQYHFGKTGFNKFRPYVGIGAMYAWFDDIKLNKGLESDLIAAGHMIQNVLDDKAGAALAGKTSSANPYVKVKADTALAPMATAGFTYDFNDRWFTTASVSYAALNNKAKILVLSDKDNSELIRAETTVDINPLITYLGVGYRF